MIEGTRLIEGKRRLRGTMVARLQSSGLAATFSFCSWRERQRRARASTPALEASSLARDRTVAAAASTAASSEIQIDNTAQALRFRFSAAGLVVLGSAEDGTPWQFSFALSALEGASPELDDHGSVVYRGTGATVQCKNREDGLYVEVELPHAQQDNLRIRVDGIEWLWRIRSEVASMPRGHE